MASINTKHGLGDRVRHFTGIHGMVTAVFIRSGGCAYEFSYLDKDTPTSVNVEECELSIQEDNPLGFRKESNGSNN